MSLPRSTVSGEVVQPAISPDYTEASPGDDIGNDREPIQVEQSR